MTRPAVAVIESSHAAEVVRLLSMRSWDTGLPLLNSHVMEVWYYLPPAQLRSLLMEVPPNLIARHPFALALYQMVGGTIPVAEISSFTPGRDTGYGTSDLFSIMMQSVQLRLAGQSR